MSLRVAPLVLAQVAEFLCPRTGCGSGQSLAGIFLAPALGKYSRPQGDSLMCASLGICLSGLVTRTPGGGLPQQSPHKELESPQGDPGGHFLEKLPPLCPVGPAPQHPNSMGSDLTKPPPFPCVCPRKLFLLCMFFVSDFICTGCSVACFFPSTQASGSLPIGPLLPWGLRGGSTGHPSMGRWGSSDTHPHVPFGGS